MELEKYKTSLLSKIYRVEDLIQELGKFLQKEFPQRKLEILLWEEKKGAFTPFFSEQEISFPVYDPFLLYLTEKDTILDAQELQKEKEPALKESIQTFLQKTQAEIIFPLLINEALLGVGYFQRGNTPLSQEERETLEEIRKITTLALSNAITYERLEALLASLEEKVKEREEELKEYQTQMIQQEKMASLGVMIAGVAHEMNTPAGVIQGALANLQKDLQKIYPLLEKISSIEKRKDLSSSQKFLLQRKIKKALEEKPYSSRKKELIAELHSGYQLSLEELEKKSEEELLSLKNALRIQQNLSNIQYAAQTITRIVQALKFYSYIDEAKKDKIDITECIENILIVHHNQLKHGIQIEKNYEKPLPPIFAYVGELNQVWSNLISNAVHAMEGKGTLKIEIKKTYFPYPPDTRIVHKEENLASLEIPSSSYPYIRVLIEDSGKGIPPEIQDKIFDPFFTTKGPGKGTGLGLGIVQRVIQKHKGAIAFSSKPGQTRFLVYLPVDEKENS